LSSLSKQDRDKEIVRLIDKERMTMTAVAKLFGISKQRVQQIYRREKDV
jgi:DNA-directed RNA polymerase specialized sigma subunit